MNLNLKIMKKNLLFVVAIFLATTMSAQLYVGAKLGYGLGANKYEAGTIMTDNSQSIEWGSMGQGLQLGAKVGYFFSDNLGFELGIDYFMSAEGVIGDVELTMAPGMVYSNDVTAKSNQLRLVPQLVMKSDMGVYSRFGIIVPVMGKTVVTKKEVTPGASTTTADVEMEFKGKFSIGFAGALGYEYALSDNLNLFGELQYTGLTIRGSSSEVTKYSVNGADQLPGMTTIQKETTFVDELDASSNNGSYNTSPDASKPLDDLRSSTVYSSYGFNIGVNFAF